jgi:hypothetical protein
VAKQLSINPVPKLNLASLSVVLWNLTPLVGVFLLGWKPISVFVFYALETIVIGAFNVLRLIAVYYYGKPPGPDESGVTGLGIIPFFIVHYSFFVFVQLSIFFSTAGLGSFSINNILGNPGSAPNLPFSNFVLLAFVINNTYLFVNDFILTGAYTQRTMGQQMFEPYPRIFVQQFVVILGTFLYVISGSGMALLVIFMLVKTYFDLVLKDFNISALSAAAEKKVEA